MGSKSAQTLPVQVENWVKFFLCFLTWDWKKEYEFNEIRVEKDLTTFFSWIFSDPAQIFQPRFIIRKKIQNSNLWGLKLKLLSLECLLHRAAH